MEVEGFTPRCSAATGGLHIAVVDTDNFDSSSALLQYIYVPTVHMYIPYVHIATQLFFY
jgi:hypothetical protein